MSIQPNVYIGTDSGATMSKVGGVWADGTTISTKLQQRPTNFAQGPETVLAGWVHAVDDFLAANALTWDQVHGVGLAIPGPYQRYGVLGKSANLPAGFDGWDVHTAYSQALAQRAGRAVPLVVGNDGALGGVGEAQRVRGAGSGGVLMLAPGSGLGSAYIAPDGLPLEGDTLAGMETAHMAAPLHLLGAKAYACGCGRTWGCIELYTTLAGLPHLLAEKIGEHPDHPLAKSTATPKERAMALRGLAQKGDALAVELFDFQARALGLHVAKLAMVLDPAWVVVGGGLMDPESTSVAFRERYLHIVSETARPLLWPQQRDRIRVLPSTLGELSQAIGAALVALYRSRR
ncbi:MAG TPA: ROK family protein [Polyangia bacterium]|nr:ROK family protein [Polyangia bacterium]